MILYYLTILLGAFLVFQVQPVMAKIILPWFGGAAAVWTTCLLFFQVVLLLGYLYAHALIRYLKPRLQALVHAVLLAASAAALPIYPGAGWKPPALADPTGRILALLAVTIGIPYLLLAATGPLVQAWFARRYPAESPYRLYALSNIGSMAALVCYPPLVEPHLTTHQQAWTWSAVYLGFLALCGYVAVRSGSGMAKPLGELEESKPPVLGDYALWLSLPACASMLLLAVTNHLTQNVAPIPFLWILPLAIYLLSFIFCFQEPSRYDRRLYGRLVTYAIWGMAVVLGIDIQGSMPLQLLIPAFIAGLFVCCMACHGELVHLKPHPRYLTHFYLTMAAGGALGGILVALAAPHVFKGYYEFPLALVACRWLIVVAVQRDHGSVSFRSWLKPGPLVTLGLLVALAGYLAFLAYQSEQGARVLIRNFYGTLKVRDKGPLRTLTHGTISHGQEFLAADRRDWPTAYYGTESGVGEAIRQKQAAGPIRVGVIGLGTGTVAAYSRPGDTYRFYELNPLVIDIARSQFWFLKDARGHVEVVAGDGRLSLEREAPQGFDVLVADAFSGDSIPIHLLTREAMALYFRHLKPDGILAIHVSNRYLDLRPVLAAEGDAAGKVVRALDSSADDDRGVFGANWVLLASKGVMGEDIATHSVRITPRAFDRVWTDDYSNPFSMLR